MDKDGNLTLEFEELKNLIRKLGLTPTDMTDEEITTVFKTLDKDGSGSLNIDELMEAITVRLPGCRPNLSGLKQIVKSRAI